jgi:hypothetical protein
MLRPMLLVSGILLALFYVVDRLAWNKEPGGVNDKRGVSRQVRIEGLHNVLYLAGVVAAVLVSGLWDGGATILIGLGSRMSISGLVRDAILLVLTYLSWKTTRNSIRIENAFSWTPIQEVAILFAAILAACCGSVAKAANALFGATPGIGRRASTWPFTPQGAPTAH